MSISLFLAALLLPAAAPAQAQPQTDPEAEMRCLAASALYADTLDKDDAMPIAAVMMFYLGRVSARMTPQQISEKLEKAEAALKDSDVKAATLSCFEEVDRVSDPL